MWKIIDKLGVFFVNFFTALKFAAFDYDARLRLTKTNRQRYIIWLTITAVTLVICYLLLFFLGQFIKNILKNRPELIPER
jgi:hypothetical protein